ncbi:UDP-N-acetylmuramoyl-L-alanyl-D-glutamate--2,6-diaminopimelate ligase [Neoroseomonas rubea]|uniref:UDP-N-acetylmuramoyl-L-alanyl-D-glutamate--2, 6-diaminopimelate ligase n=1 Tax=Neoroseomonas rubea TaxID=2748666 RepID=UPI0018E0311E|nr:UDP-N-acetylmuramoyl-L-alanyl-D-glutamate--2,6-diaminopimelate ligase [Roseomonas rubea]
MMRRAGLAATAPEGEPISGLTADSRAVVPGMVFAALPGARADGRAFIADAVERGAAVVLAPEGTEWPPGVPVRPLITAADPRRTLALMAAAFHRAQPRTVVAVTGTNGKTSTVDFLRQIWIAAGEKAASLGTLGLVAEGFPPGPSLTTPDPVALHATLSALARTGFGAAAMEASSHGIDQRRLDGVVLAAAGFTNLTRDHLDYHGTMEAYRAAKLRLFDTLLPAGAAAAACTEMDAETLAALRATARTRGQRLLTVGDAGEALRLVAARPRPDGLDLEILAFGARHEIRLPLPGRFQADNALLAAALAVGAGQPADRVLAALPQLRGVRGRMERAAVLANGAAVYVDYAHSPDALTRLLAALRPHTDGRLHVLFGAGGDRDPGKRPLMGAAAAAGADKVWITDDNPRSEDPAAIRAAVMAGAPDAIDAGAREDAIAAALSDLRAGDVLAVAGKGHESGQEIAGTVHPFDDVAVVRRLAGLAP